ncbi:YHYH domain-containing protein [Rossellomorea vietnamensis]|uniref:YHYH domain-containing protein n=1 Tax=Rossellomorea vietnamensis TaxID=218284 RepID=UPI001CCF6D75|nr:YHYH domain-containing protein [Rossellomorea vietnamensis]MCA0149698.1 YHYH domain-containing protein [Rossellomorea vietnamensis]
MIKKVCWLTLLFLLFFGSIAFAHSGRTDSSGGHNCSDKSKAKGLCTGYHSHNGGGTSSSTSSPASQPAATRSDKDCTDFGSYDEVVNYWNSKGYSATYDPENLDGWGNGVVDDGIPCEAPSGYDKTKINNSPEQFKHQQDETDMANGEEQGYAQGVKDGYQEATSNNSTTSGSDAFNEGYTAGYDKGYAEGKSKIDSEKKQATDDGYSLGQKQDELTLPDKYANHAGLKKAFENGFNKALQERLEAKKQEFTKQGYNDGKKDKHSPPNGQEDELVAAYETGYKKAQEELRQEYYDKGYKAAFSLIEYKDPGYENDKFNSWFKDGFNSNNEVKKIEKAGFSLGQQGEKISIPTEYTKGEKIFKHYYELGYKEHEEEQKKTRSAAASGFGLAALGWFGRRLYVAKKMIS